MERIRDGRRGAAGGGAPLRRRPRGLRDSAGDEEGGVMRERRKAERERERGSRSKRRRGERGNDEDEETEDSSSEEEEEDEDEEEEAEASVSGRVLPAQAAPSTPPMSSSASPSRYHQFSGSSHHSGVSTSANGNGNGHQALPKKTVHLRPPAPWRGDDMIGGAVPRKARSASKKRTSHEWLVSGGFAAAGDGTGDAAQIHRQSSPSPSSASAASPSSSGAAPVRKKLRPIGSNAAKQQQQQQRPPPPTEALPSKAAKPPPAASTQEEPVPEDLLEAAEVLSGLTIPRQFPVVPPQQFFDAGSNLAPMTVIAPKRKRPRAVKYDFDSKIPALPSAAKAEIAPPPELPTLLDNGVALQQEQSDLVAPAADPEQAPAAKQAEAVKSEAAATEGDVARDEKLSIDLMGTPPGRKPSPEKKTASSVDEDRAGRADHKDIELGKEGGSAAGPVKIDAEEQKLQKLPLKLDLEKPSGGGGGGDLKPGNEESMLERAPQQKPPKSEIKQENAVLNHSKTTAGGGWPGAAVHCPPLPARHKKCALHCYIAKMIQQHQRIVKLGTLWPQTSTSAAAGVPVPLALGIAPPAESAASPHGSRTPVDFLAKKSGSLLDSKATSATSPALHLTSTSTSLAIDSSQRKPASKDTQQIPGPGTKMQPGSTFIFSINSQQDGTTGSVLGNQGAAAKSKSAAGGVAPPSVALTSASSSGAAVNLSFGAAGLPPADAQYLAILQSGGYPFPVSNQAGGALPYRGGSSPQTVPFFNAPYYQARPIGGPQGAQVPQHMPQKSSALSSSGYSQKHQQHQSSGILGYGPNGSTATANSQAFPTNTHRSFLSASLTQQPESTKGSLDRESYVDGRSSHGQKSNEHNMNPQISLQNFTLMPGAAGGAYSSSQNDKKSSIQLQQQQMSARSQHSRDMSTSQPFVMPLSSFGGTGVLPSGLDFSYASNHGMFPSHHQDSARHGYQQFSIAGSVGMQTQPKHTQQHFAGDGKPLGESKAAPGAHENEKKKMAGGDSQHSLSFAQIDGKHTMSSFLGSGAGVLSSGAAEVSSNDFGSIGRTVNISSGQGAEAAAHNMLLVQQQQQQQQQLVQFHKQYQQHLATSRPKSAAPGGSAGGYTDRPSSGSNAAAFPPALMNLPQGIVQGSGGVPGQTQQWWKMASKPSTAAPPAGLSSANLGPAKNSSLFPPQGKASLQGQSNYSQISFNMSGSKMPPSMPSVPVGGPDVSRSSNATGSPSNSISKSTGGSPPASGSSKHGSSAVSLPPQQQLPSKSSVLGSKPAQYSMPSILGQPNVGAHSTPNKQQQPIMASQLKQQTPHSQFFLNTQASGAAAAGFYQKQEPALDPAKAMAAAAAAAAAAGGNMKVLHPAPGLLPAPHYSAAHQPATGGATQRSAASPFAYMSMPPMSVKQTTDQKPAAP